MDTPLVLFQTDRPGWCFDNIAKAVASELSERFTFKIMPNTKIARETCDVLVALCWERALLSYSNTRCRAMVTCLYDHLSWCINEESFAHFKLTLKNSAALGVCNESMKAEVEKRVPPGELPPVFLLEDGVDTARFSQEPLPRKFCVGWTGNSGRMTPGGPKDYKGLEMLREACERAEVELRVLDSGAGGAWPHVRMPLFYKDVSLQLIGSALEGTPNPLLEAMSMGRPVITTPVGLAPKLVVKGKTGWICERSVESFTEALLAAKQMMHADLSKMGRHARQAAMQWDWKHKSKAWLDCLNLAKLGKEVARTMVPVEVAAPGAARPRPKPVTTPIAPRIESAEGSGRPRPEGVRRALLISDVRDWAFHQNMRDLEEALSGDGYEFDHWFVAEWLTKGMPFEAADYDTVFCVYHRWGIDSLLPWSRTVGSLRALWFKPETPAAPGHEEYDLVNQYRAFHVVTRQNFLELRDHCPNVVYLTNPVNMTRFPEASRVHGQRVVFSWNGNARHRSGAGVDVKGFHSIIKPVVSSLKVPFVYAEYNSCRLAPAAMPAFYQQGNVAICMSLYEGASNSVMEAMASGQAVISTRAGNIEEMQQHQLSEWGESGILLVDRTPDALVSAVRTLQQDPGAVRAMGALNRMEIDERWSWQVWKQPYKDFLDATKD